MSANGILENIEEVLMELNSFEKKLTRDDCAEIPQILDDYLVFVARTGNTHFPWLKIKPLFRSKLEKVIREFSQKSDEIPPTPNVDPFQFDVVRGTVFEQLEVFAGIPFTVQRLCELLTAPSKHYKRTDKFMRALEKNMLVVSTIEAVHPSSAPTSNPSLGAMNNGVSDSFSSTLEQREREAHLLNGSSPSLAMSTDDYEKDSLKSDETGIYSPPQSNGNSGPEEQVTQNGGSSTPDLETSGPCDSGESSSSENSSPNPQFSDPTSDSTTNEAVSSYKEGEEMQESVGESKVQLKDELTDELLPLTDSMEIDSECSSSDNLLIETASSGLRREDIQDEVQSTEEEDGERPSKKFKVNNDEPSESAKVESEVLAEDKDEGGQEEDQEEESCSSSSKDDEMRGVSSPLVEKSLQPTSASEDNSRVSTSQQEDSFEAKKDDSSLCSPASSNNNEATPSTSTPSPDNNSHGEALSNVDEQQKQEEVEDSTTTTTTTTSSSSSSPSRDPEASESPST